MEEAERLCDRRCRPAGAAVALDTPSGPLPCTVAGESPSPPVGSSWTGSTAFPGVARVERHGAAVRVEGTGRVLPLVAAGLVERGVVPDDLHVAQPTLEDAFLALVGTGEE
jgi:hypothetical protein